MGKEDFVLVFDIGSSKIRAVKAGRGLNNTFNIKSEKTVEYDGFYEGEFLKQEKLSYVFEQILGEFDIASSRLNKVFISVPAEFSSARTTEVTVHLGDRRKIKKADVDSLFYMAGEKAKNADVEVVSINPIYYLLDDGRYTVEPVGENALSITAKMSIIYADRKYIDLFNSIISTFDFARVEYISDALAQALFVIPKEKREDVALLVDVGDLTTSIAFAKGEGLIGLTSFARGGGFITNDLSEALDISMTEAERLKKQIVLSLKGKQNDFYELTSDIGKTVKIPLSLANEVAGYRIDELAQVISKCAQMWTNEYAYLPIYLTGAGISKIKGGRDYLAKCLGRNVNYGQPPLPGKDKPELSSIYSLINEALKSEKI